MIVLVLGVEERDLVRLHRHDPVVELHQVALLVAVAGVLARDRPEDLLHVQISGRELAAPLHGPFQGGSVYRLEKVVYGSGLERLDGVAVIGRRHHDRFLDGHLTENLEALAVR